MRKGQYYQNRRLRSLYVPPTVKVIEEQAFQYCSKLLAVTLRGAREIGDCAFKFCSLKELTIPGSVNKIGGWAFNGCKYLSSVEIADGVQAIGDFAFYYSSLSSVRIPSSVRHIGKHPFPKTTSLASSSDWFCVENNEFVDVEEGRLITYIGKESEHVVSEGIVIIGDYAFATCKELESVTISSTVEEIRDNAFDSTGLIHVKIPGSVRRIGSCAFCGCKSLRTVKLKEGLESIGGGLFMGTRFRSLTIPYSLWSNNGIDCISLRMSSIKNICYIIHKKKETSQLESKAVGGKNVETITFEQKA